MQTIIDNNLIDLINYIIQNFLNPVDLHLLRQVSKYFLSKIGRNSVYCTVLRNMNCVLKDIFGDNLTEFKELIERNNAVISGSFITQCVLDEYWSQSDVDIFILNDETKSTYTDFKKFLCEKMGFKKRSYDPFFHYKYTGITEILIMVSYKTYHNLEYSVHIMWINIKDDILINFVWNMCDFDICRNTYHINNKREVLNICAINDICTKTTKFKIGHELGFTMDRYYKYIDRGFHIRCDISYEELVKSSYTYTISWTGDSCEWRRYEIFKVKKINESYISDDGFFIDTYKLIEGDIDKLSHLEDWNETIFLNNDVLTINHRNYECNNKRCPLFFCGSNAQHFHIGGVYYGDDAKSTFIVIIIE